MWGKIKNAGDDWMYPKPLMDLRCYSLLYVAPYRDFIPLLFIMFVHLYFMLCLFSFVLFHILLLRANVLVSFHSVDGI